MTNGLGATTPIEQYLVHRAACAELRARGLQVHRSYVGEYVTSLQMAGVSVSLLRLDDELAPLLDRPRPLDRLACVNADVAMAADLVRAAARH
ncbi:MAG: dihydroxyacetone kinase subunit DhaK [Candidatus Binatia bacterium]